MTSSDIPAIPARKTSGLAITSLVLGCFSFILLCVTGLPALICGIVSLNQISKNPALGGRGLAIAGIVLGGLSFVLLPVIGVLAGLAVPAVSAALNKAKQTQEVADIRAVGRVLFEYASKHEGHYPDSFETFIGSGLMSEEDQTRLLYKKDSHEIRWTLTPGLKVTDDEDTVLLQSIESLGTGRQLGHAIYTIGNQATWVKEWTENQRRTE